MIDFAKISEAENERFEAGLAALAEIGVEFESREEVPPILAAALLDFGIEATPGKSATPEILDAYAAAGHPEVKSDEVSWCSAMSARWVKRSGAHPALTLAARDWRLWGKPVDEPEAGHVCALWRESPDSWKGHVGIVAKVELTRVWVVGGNQGGGRGKPSAVTLTSFPIARVLAYREPVTPQNSLTVKGAKTAASGTVTTTVAQAAEPVAKAVHSVAEQLAPEAAKAGEALAPLAKLLPILGVIGALITAAGVLLVLYARYKDAVEKGR